MTTIFKKSIIAGLVISLLLAVVIGVTLRGNPANAFLDSDSQMDKLLDLMILKEMNKLDEGSLDRLGGVYSPYQKDFAEGISVKETLVIDPDGNIIPNTQTSNPTNVTTEGTQYYNSSSKVLRMYDGSNWFTIGTSTSGLTLSGMRLQLSDLNQYITFGTTTESGLSLITVQASTTATIPLTLKGFLSQTANLFQVQNSAGTELFALDHNGNASTTMISTGAFWTSGLSIFNAGTLKSYTNSTSTLATTYTLVEADILNYDTMLLTLNVGSATFTLPASSTLTSMVPTAGDKQELCIHNATTTALVNLTIAAGTGIDLSTSSSTPTDLTISGGEFGCFKFIRQTDSDVSVLMTEYQAAD